MKKFFACFIVFLLLLTSCNKFIVENIYQQRYDKEDVAMVDMYTHLCYYDIDSIYMDLWIPRFTGLPRQSGKSRFPRSFRKYRRSRIPRQSGIPRFTGLP